MTEMWTKIAVILGMGVGAFALLFVMGRLIRRAFERRGLKWSGRTLERDLRMPWVVVMLSLILRVAISFVLVAPRLESGLNHVASVMLIAGVAWLLLRGATFLRQRLYEIFDTNRPDNFRQRSVRTQIDFIYRLAVILVFFAATSAILLNFQDFRKVGASLLASAGVASIVIGFAAQRSIANLIAGFQIAFTQPIRLDDVVIVEKEWGRVEEITLTYIVVKLWDLRRMILPITYFIEKPFENWTRDRADILGYSFLYVDYSADVRALQAELRRICDQSLLWDRGTCLLQVTNLTERTMELRALVSARNASNAFDLRCEIRERMIAYLQEKSPQSLPKVRIDSPSAVDG